MKDLARAVALLLAVVVLVRDDAIAAGAPAMRTATLVVAFVLLAGLTLWRDGFVTASGVALGAHYVLALAFGHVEADLGAPIVGALIVAHLDLLELSASLPRDRRIDRAFLRDRLRHLGLVLALGVAGGAAALGVALVPWPSSELLRAAGVLAVAGVVALPLGLLRARR
jgi:hypothetical protein